MIDIVDLYCAIFLSSCFWGSLLLPGNIVNLSRLNRLMILFAFIMLSGVSMFSLSSSSFFARYILVLCYFHCSEFVWVSITSRKCLFDSFLINHGIHYASAFTLSALEHFVFPFHYPPLVQQIGFILSIVGLVVGGVCLLTAGEAFTHLIAHRKSANHRLVTHGIYSWIRHPGYCGWLIWVSSSQVLAGNIISSLAFFCVSIYFFRERIEYEESLLISFFGNAYIQYKKRVPYGGVPFINS